MNPHLAGLLATVAHDALATDPSSFPPDPVGDHLRAAAGDLAGETDGPGPDPETLLDALASDAVGAQVEQFRSGSPLDPGDLAAAVGDRPGGHFPDSGSDGGDPVEDLLWAFEDRIAADSLWDRLIRGYVRAGRMDGAAGGDEHGDPNHPLEGLPPVDLDALGAAVEALAEEGGREGLVDPVELDGALSRLADDGFRLVTARDFAVGPCDPGACWRRGFSLREVREGYAVDRERPPVEGPEADGELDGGDLRTGSSSEDGARTDLTGELVGGLRDGDQRVVLGDPGEGKTTVLRSVAERWERREDTGPVLYRGPASLRRMGSPEGFAGAVEAVTGADGPALVVVEDAAGEATVPLYAAVDRHADDDRVSYLLEARGREFEREPFRNLVRRHPTVDLDSPAGHRVVASHGDHLQRVHLPPLDRTEVGRIVDRFEAVTGRTVPGDPVAIHDGIRPDRDAGAMLQLVYHLPVGSDPEGVAHGDPPDDPDGRAGGGQSPESAPAPSMLAANVRATFDAVTDPAESDRILAGGPSDADAALLERVGLSVAILNAAGIGVRRELLLALADDDAERRRVDEVLSALEGTLAFGREGTRHLAHHELWSCLYLDRHRARYGDAVARRAFEDCANDLLSVLDGNVREAVAGRCGETELLAEIEADPTAVADALVAGIVGIAGQRPSLVHLLSTAERSGIDLPTACSDRRRATAATARATAWRRHGVLELAAAEHGVARDRDLATDRDPMAVDADYHLALGRIAWERDDLDRCARVNRRSRRLYRELGDTLGEAVALNNLGGVAKRQGDHDRAVDLFRRSLELKREVGDPVGKATTLGNLGNTAAARGDPGEAGEYLRDALAIEREMGDAPGAAGSLTNLGLVAENEGDLDRAEDNYRRSLARERELGDAEGEAMAHNNLGSAAQARGEYDRAADHLRESLSLAREVHNRDAEARVLGNLGDVARQRGDLEATQEYYRAAARIHREEGADRQALATLEDLSAVAAWRGDDETALEACETGLSLVEGTDLADAEGTARSLRIRAARLRETPESTVELYVQALRHVLGEDPGTALSLFEDAWGRRERFGPDDGVYPVVLGAGVGYAAHLELLDVDDPRDTDAVLAAVDPHAADLSTAARALYDRLTGGDPGVTPTELREAADADPGDTTQAPLADLEARAYADLLGLLGEPGSAETLPTHEVYERALREANAEDPDPHEVMDLLGRAWERRADHDPGTEAHGEAMAAGVGLAAHLELLDPEAGEWEGDPGAIVDEVADHADALPPAATAVFGHLAEGEARVSPDALRGVVGPVLSDPTLTELETLVFADLLAALREG